MWHTMDMYDVQAILRNLDPENTGYINWRKFMTYMILVTSESMTPHAAQMLRSASDE